MDVFRKLFPKGRRERALEKGIEILRSKNYEFEIKLGSGTYGDVISVRKADKSKVAAKIVLLENVTYGEIHLWPLFRHQNVLKLLETFELPDMNVYLMPLYEMTLSQAVRKKFFTKNSRSFYYSKCWLGDVLRGMDYLHDNNICHLDIKEDNVLIASDMRAVLSDFSATLNTYDKVILNGFPIQLAAPETSPVEYIDGIAYDVWGFGILALNIWTDRWYRKQIKKCLNWEKDIYPFIFKSVQYDNFASLLKSSFPGADMNKMDRVLANNLLLGTLRYGAEKRPPVSVLRRHLLFGEAGCSKTLLDPDNIWIQEHFQRVSEETSNESASFAMNSCLPGDDASRNLLCTNELKVDKKKLSLGKRIKKWFRKKLNRIVCC